MAIPTTRTKENGKVTINQNSCTGCALCVEICCDKYLIIQNNKASTNEKSFFGCIGCGHCMMVCPTDSIGVNGREISNNDLLDRDKNQVTYDDLCQLMLNRRSIREFKNTDIDREVIEKILAAAQTAPIGLPPSDVHVIVFDSKTKVQNFAKDFATYLSGIRWVVSSFYINFMRPFWGKTTDELMKNFIKPLVNTYVEEMKKGNNWINYDAPLAIYFYGSPYADPADPLIAATYAMLAGESLGLGSCMLGAIHPFIQYGKKAKKLREKYGIKYTSREGIFVVFGYPKAKFRKNIKRTFANIHWV